MRKSVEYRSSSKDVFKRFKQANPEIKIDFNTWISIIYNFNYSFRDYILETGYRGKFIFGFGDFAITKWKPFKTILVNGKEKINLPTDWKKTKEYGKRIYHMNYHTDGYKFKWKWFTNSGRFWSSALWNFKPSRVSSRLLNHYLTLPDYQDKYLTWK